MRKIVVAVTFLGAALGVRAAVAGSTASHPILGILGIIFGLALAGLVVALPALLVSAALRNFFNEKDAECDEPEGRLFALPSAVEAHTPAIAAKR